MAPPSVFVTGVTGYMGGDALSVIYEAHPDWQYSFYVRSEQRAAPVKSQFPNGRLVVGSLADLEILEREAAAADIVMHFASSDDEPSAKAIARGLAAHDPAKPGYLIHISGSANLTYADLSTNTFGQFRDKIWDDVADVKDITSLPADAPHRNVDTIVLAAGAPTVPHVRRAIVCPPCLVGAGRGPVNRRTLQVPILIEIMRQRRRGFRIGAGKSRWSFVHIHDLSDAFLLLVEDAAAGGPRANWGEGAYYFTENGEREWGLVSDRVAARLHAKGAIPAADVDVLTADEAGAFSMFAPLSFGCNSRCRATRFRDALGWKPTRADFEAEFDIAVDHELESGQQSRLVDFDQGHMPSIEGNLVK